MIGWVKGRIQHKDPARTVVDVGGVGYLVHVPLSTFFGLGAPGDEVELLIHTHVREEALQLYGFLTQLELQLFERLLGVTQIGPKLALTALSGLTPPELLQALQAEDVKRLATIPGIGQKIAGRMVFELKDKLDHLTATPSLSVIRQPADGERDAREDALSALLNLGYKRKDAEAALEHAARSASGLEGLLRAALARLSR